MQAVIDWPRGIRTDLSNDSYHTGPGISKSGLWTLQTKSPAHFRFGEKTETDSMRLGTLTHSAVLEPDKFAAEYRAGPDAARNTKEWKAAVEANAGFTLIKPDEYAAACRTRDALHADPTIRSIFAAKPVIEASAYWIDELTGELCRCRPDAAIPGLLIDLKTIADASGDNCVRAVQNYGYHCQAAYYGDGWQIASGELGCSPMLFIFVEPKIPQQFKLIELDYEFVEMGRKIYRRALNTYSECRKRNEWPGYPTVVQTVAPMGFYQTTFNKEFSYAE